MRSIGRGRGRGREAGRGRGRAGAVVAGLVAAGLTVVASPTTAEAADDGGLGTVVTDGSIAGDDGNIFGPKDLFVLREGAFVRLTHNTTDPETDFTYSSGSPSLSPDGTRMVYHRCERAEFVIGMRASSPTFPICRPHVMNVDGTGDQTIEINEANEYPRTDADYDWGAGGILFTRGGTLYRLDPSTEAVSEVSDSATTYWFRPSWSPDGTRLVVEGTPKDEFGEPDGRPDLWVMNADGTGATNITSTPAVYEERAKWSPDGADIMAEKATPGSDDSDAFCVEVMSSDGSSRQCLQVWSYVADLTTAAWSKDSSYAGLTWTDLADATNRFGFLPRDNSTTELVGVAELPNGSSEVDWYGEADLPPTAFDQELTVPGNGSAAVTLTGTDPDGDPLSYAVVTQPEHGTLSGTAPELVYAPVDGYSGPDEFTFRVSAGGETSAPATVSITVTEPCDVLGTNSRDRLRGTAGDDVICALAGNDVVLAMGGDDIVYGGSGDDDLVGGAGDDRLDGGADDDAVRGDTGNDDLVGGEGNDLVSYLSATGPATVDIASQSASAQGAGSDTMSGVENAFGTGYADRLSGDDGDNQLLGGSGDDKLVGRGGNDELNAKNGRDALNGGSGRDALFGGDAYDDLVGGTGPDSCYVDADGGRRRGCENDDDGTRARSAVRTVEPRGVVRPRGVVGEVSYARLGNDDWLVTFNRAASVQVAWDAIQDDATWENNWCYYLARTPAKEACDGPKLKTIWKYWTKEYLSYWGYNKSACLDVVLDRGRHASYGFRKKWKIRAGTNANNHLYNYYTMPGRTDSIEVSDSGETGYQWVDVTCVP